MEKREVVIVGAGPGGLKCAEVLANKGKDVLVLEKNNIIGDKVCAGGLTLKDLGLGIPDSIIQRKFNKIIIHTPLQDTEIELEEPFLATLDRKDLGKWMAEKAKKQGAEIRTETLVKEIKNNKIILNDSEIEFKHLIGADGSNSIVRKHLGLSSKKVLQAFQYITPKKFEALELFIDPSKYGPAYLWIFPYKNSASIGTGADLKSQQILGLKASDVRNNFNKWCKSSIDIKKSKFQAFIINYDYQGHEFKNKFLVGDAAGFASGLSGEGIYFAIKSGEDVAMKILDKEYSCPNIKHILKVKKIEESIQKSLELNKTWSELEWELVNLMFKIRWISKEFFMMI